MNPDAVFNRYDIRGEYPDEIDETFAQRIGKAAGTHVQEHGRGTVVVGRDTRETSENVSDAFINGVRSTGASVVDTGVGTTDRVGLAAQHYGGIGVMVTASHHSWERTGFKFLYEQGHGFSNADLDRIQDIFESEVFDSGDGSLLYVQDEFDEAYIEEVKQSFNNIVDHDISGTVLIDTAGGAKRTVGLLFEELGAEVIEVERDGLPAPEPNEQTRQDVYTELEDTGANLAVGYDPDGDRVYAIHPDVGWLDGDTLFYLLGHITGAQTIVGSIDTSPMVEELDADVTYTRVGDIFVSAKGVELEADLLGEPNGHYAVTDFCWYNSGIFASLLLFAYHDQIPDIVSAVQDYETYRFVETFETREEQDAAMTEAIKNVAKNFEITSTLDGMKFETDGVTGLVRPSGTSPKIRLILHTRNDNTDPEKIREQIF